MLPKKLTLRKMVKDFRNLIPLTEKKNYRQDFKLDPLLQQNKIEKKKQSNWRGVQLFL